MLKSGSVRVPAGASALDVRETDPTADRPSSECFVARSAYSGRLAFGLRHAQLEIPLVVSIYLRASGNAMLHACLLTGSGATYCGIAPSVLGLPRDGRAFR